MILGGGGIICISGWIWMMKAESTAENRPAWVKYDISLVVEMGSVAHEDETGIQIRAIFFQEFIVIFIGDLLVCIPKRCLRIRGRLTSRNLELETFDGLLDS
jgi:hypothetical protein